MIKVEGISKKFKLYHSPADRLREILFRKSYHKDFIALDNISFEVGPGQTLGIIGDNGAGKSTLLKILSGIVIPDSGSITVDGKVTGLLELGTGFNYEMTGIENIYMNGTLLGMTRDEIDRKKQTIIDFSELGEFIYEPIKTYSSGMVMRLAFSIAIHAEPTCFLVDEALSVGDAYFQQKCMRKIQEFRESGGSIVFVSHDMNAVTTLCDYAILLNHGKMVSFGIPRGIIDLYITQICLSSHSGERIVIHNDEKKPEKNHANISTNKIEFGAIRILDCKKQPVTHVYGEDEIIINYSFRCLRDIEEPVFGILIRNRYGVSIFGTNTHLLNQKNNPVMAGKWYDVSVKFRLLLQPDEYLITIAIDNGGRAVNSFEEYLLRLNDIITLRVLQNKNLPVYLGITDLHPSIEIESIPD
ncbi:MULTISPECIES: ABC transporter ATP-binding protein [unclassified Methanoregula]|uniref:ABC transporter ATP-binding protein n=1 Tax=unclassified Methanoregula TaxID=2649730 RepID=UPI0009C447BA|nr:MULTISPECIES: ABC transporter ATP-binding protein [unclassified Methanoregula]OPX65141.1 MAG: Trehalose/maltose import ATP-binding protein MalK [Methanoregula sp. PtaB.Bin085]OPY32053.1 MAG: Trehalose/maltose import ATP-binding protein MalK [Methanoregula sp. PtaU1.Bin006]